MEIQKKDLLLKLQESWNSEIDEMSDYKKQQGLQKSWEPIMSEPQTDIPGYEGSYKARGAEFKHGRIGKKEKQLPIKTKGEHIGHKVIDLNTGGEIAVFYPCDIDAQEFMNKYKDAIQSLTDEYGVENVYRSLKRTMPGCEPRTTSTKDTSLVKMHTGDEVNVNRQVKFETEINDAEYLKRYLIYPMVDQIFGNEVNEHLKKCSIPTIHLNDRAHLDRHSTFKNNVLTYQSMNFNSYKDVRDFYNSAVRNVNGIETTELESEYREHHLARQFNQSYKNWEKDRKGSGVFWGFTDLYNLEGSGYSPTTFDVTVFSLFTIKGSLITTEDGFKYKWDINFSTEHGKNLRDNDQLERLKMNKDEVCTGSTETESFEINYDSINKKDIIAKNDYVREALQDCLTQVRKQILAIPIVEQLKKATIYKFQLSADETENLKKERAARLARFADDDDDEEQTEPQGQEQPQLSESQLDIVKNILLKLKK